MTLFVRRVILTGLGLVAGLLAWPLSEAIVASQGAFSSLLLYTIISGAAIGLTFGAVFGSAPGIYLSRTRRILTGIGWGAMIGSLGGATGFLIGQAVLLVLGEHLAVPGSSLYTYAIPLARAVGWAILGAFAGASEGFRARSRLKIQAGSIGGLLGGALGGSAVEYGRILTGAVPAARLAAFLLLGVAIALCYALVERRLSFGVLRLLNGPWKGREFIINQRSIRIGTADSCDVAVSGYSKLAANHLSIEVRGKDLYAVAADKPIRVNDEQYRSGDKAEPAGPLKFEDVIAAGEAKFLYRAE